MFTEPSYRRVLSERVHRATSTKRIFIKSPRPLLSFRASVVQGGVGWDNRMESKLYGLAEPLNGRRYPSSSPTPLGHPFLAQRLPESFLPTNQLYRSNRSLASDLRRIIIYVCRRRCSCVPLQEVAASFQRRCGVSILLQRERAKLPQQEPIKRAPPAEISSRASSLLASLSSLSTLDVDACTNHGHDFNEYSIDFLDPLKERERLRGDLRWVSSSLSLSIGTRWTPSRIEDTVRARARVSYTKIKVGQTSHGERVRIKFYRRLVPLTPKALACFTFKTHYRAARFESHAAIK